ncbi:Helicase SKI2W, partial [Caligus rogercresseyi]
LKPESGKNIWITLINHLNHHDKLPVVAFTLSRKRCDQNAVMLTSLDLCSEVERHSIHQFIHEHICVLNSSDRLLPQVTRMTELLKRGIGIHHAGVLPILKELVEMLFQRGLVKLLFATETFAVGINMPTRTVIFDDIRKHDGSEFRNLLPSEYIQMAGRAGRRGLDSTGTVIILIKDKLFRADELQRMMLGKPTSLESKFQLTYSMILNLFKVRQLRVEDMMKRSFSEKELLKNQGAYRERMATLKVELERNAAKTSSGSDAMKEAYELASRYYNLRNPFWSKLLRMPLVQGVLLPGRIVLVHVHRVFKYGVLLHSNASVEPHTYDVLVYKSSEGVEEQHPPNLEEEFSRFINFTRRRLPLWDPLSTGHTKEYAQVSLKDLDILDITKRDSLPEETTSLLLKELSKFSHKNQDMMSASSFLHPIKDLKVKDIDDMEMVHRLHTISNSESQEDGSSIDFLEGFQCVYEEKKKLKEIENLEHLLSDNSLKFLPDYNNRVEVLRTLQYINEDKIVKLKGRVASKMSHHELLVTELIFRKIITDRSPEEIAALLSCIVFKNNKIPVPDLNPSLKEGMSDIRKVAEEIGSVQRDCGFDEPVKQYVDNFCFGLTEVVYEWAKGLPFAEIIQLTEVHEGTIVNIIQMLDEVLRNIKDAALFDIGDPILKQKMDEASKAIRRDI